MVTERMIRGVGEPSELEFPMERWPIDRYDQQTDRAVSLLTPRLHSRYRPGPLRPDVDASRRS